MTYYEVLQVTEDASIEVIKASWKALAQKYHPDRPESRSKQAQEKIRKINEAKDILTGPEKRALYDLSLRQNGASEFYADTRPRQRPASPRGQTSSKQRRAYDPAYGDAYPGHSASSSDGLIEQFIDNAVAGGQVDPLKLLEQLNMVVLEKMKERNPILRAIIENYGSGKR